MMAVTLKEIAEKSGFSSSTVSHAISGRNPGNRALSAETVAKIRAVAKSLGYRPNLLAAGLAQQKTFAVGVLVAMLRGDFYERILEGISDVVYPEFSPLLAIHGYDPERERRELDLFIGKRVDGVIAAVSGDAQNLETYRLLQKQYGTAMVLVDRGIEGLDCPVVRGDHEQTAYMAARELQKLGHKRIMYATEGSATIESTMLFKRGYANAMVEAGLDPLILHLQTAAWTREGTTELAKMIVEQVCKNKSSAPTAVICPVDWLAYEIMALCDERGIHIPNDLSLMGLQNCEPSGLPGVALSAISVPFEEIGRQAAKILMKLVRHEEVEEKTILIEPSVVLRKTTAKV